MHRHDWLYVWIPTDPNVGTSRLQNIFDIWDVIEAVPFLFDLKGHLNIKFGLKS